MKRIIFLTTLFLSQAAQAFPNPFPSGSSSTAVDAQDFSKTVLSITQLKLKLKLKLVPGIEGRFGTGFCLDPACRFIGTNYHIAKIARPRKIEGEKVIKRYLATGPDDEGATVNESVSASPMKYTLSRDLAILELHHSLTHYHGASFSLDDLEVGQQVDIYTYPKEGINPIRRLLLFHGAFSGRTPTGLLAFDYRFSAGRTIRPGASGGIVVDSKSQQIVGILNGIARNGEAVALAVPVQSLLEFVTKVQPYLSQNIFPSTQGISPVSADLYPKFVPSPADVLEHRPAELADVKLLRRKAQLLADSMRNFIAVQTFVWGSGNKEPAAASAYEVQILDGNQRFREYPDGKKELQNVVLPPLNTVMAPGGEWSELPEMVGTKLGLKIHQGADVVANERRMKVFQYWADPEDEVCKWRTVVGFGFFSINRDVTVACYGEVWTDEETNILRMSEHYELSGKWREFQGVVTYGWLQRPDETPRLIPLTISTQAEFNKKVYWCRGQFVNYKIFGSRVKILAN